MVVFWEYPNEHRPIGGGISSKNKRRVAANDQSTHVAEARRLRGVRGAAKSSESWDVEVTYTESAWIIFGGTCEVDVVGPTVLGRRVCSRVVLVVRSCVMSFSSSAHWLWCLMRRHRLRSLATSTC